MAAVVALLTMAAPAARAAPASGNRPPSPGCFAPTALPTTVLGRDYLVHSPPGHDPHAPLPLILAFHGAKQSAATIRDYSGLDRADAVVVYPQGRVGSGGHRYWSPTDDLPDAAPDIAYTAALVGAVEKAYCVDPTRVSATGKSQGAGFTYTLACRAPGLVTAIAPVAAAVYRPGEHHGIDPATCASGPRRVLEFHGDADSVIDYTGTARSRPIRSVGADLGLVDEWVRRDRCGAEDPPRADEPADVELHRWSRCADGSEVSHYRLHGAGHTWPGSTPGTSGGGDDVTSERVDATAQILRFLGVATSPS